MNQPSTTTPASSTPAQPTPAGPPLFQRYPWLKTLLWQGKVLPAFWTIASLVSLAVNLVLIVVLILVGRQLFTLKTLIDQQLLGGLAQNFALMDQSHIQTTIPISETIQVNDTIPVVFDLPLNTETTVILTKETTIPETWVTIKTGIIDLNAPAEITLPAGTPLAIELDLVVPVNQTIPVALSVPVRMSVTVDIPLDQTELHKPFTGLQGVVQPYQGLMSSLPNTWGETPLCKPLNGWLCKLFGMK